MNAMRATDIIRHLLDQGMPTCPPDMRGWMVPPKSLRQLCDLADAVQEMMGRHGADERDVLIELAIMTWRAFNDDYLGVPDDGDDDEQTNPHMPSSPDLLKTAKG